MGGKGDQRHADAGNGFGIEQAFEVFGGDAAACAQTLCAGGIKVRQPMANAMMTLISTVLSSVVSDPERIGRALRRPGHKSD